MLIVESYVPKKSLSRDANIFLNILCSNKLNNIAHCLVNDYCMSNIPALTFVLTNFDRIVNHISNKKDVEFVKHLDIVSNFLTKEHKSLTFPYHIPKFNLYHVGAICHLNSCISMLSSLTYLIKEMENICLFKKFIITDSFKKIYQYILNSYSRVDLNINYIFEVVSSLDINPNIFGEATETMKKLIRILYKNGISKSVVLFWDSSEEFGSLSDEINKFHPRYVIINSHDMNTLFDIDTDKVKIKEFEVSNKNKYTLISFVSFYLNHFVAAFKYDNFTYKINNDLHTRYHIEMVNSNVLFRDNSSHVLACYMLVE